MNSTKSQGAHLPYRSPACDRCHKIKVKCALLPATFPPTACDRCARLGHRCTLERRTRPLGRPRAPEHASNAPLAGREFVWDLSPATASRRSEGFLGHLRQAAAAGDLSPTEKRDVAARSTGGVAVAGLRSFTLTIEPPDALLSRLTSRDETLLRRITFDKTAYLHRFVLSPEHANSLLRDIFVSVNTSPDALLKISLACLGRFSTKLRLNPHPDISRDYKNCASAVQSLREMADATSMGTLDLVTMLTLGLGIVTFDLSETGMYAHSICRNTLKLADRHLCLSAVDPGQRAAITDDLGSNLLPLVIMDTYNCLVRRQVPVMRLHLRDTETVDKYIGVCWPLLPYLYDICCLNHGLSSQSSPAPGGQPGAYLGPDIRRRLEEVEDAVFSWHPYIPVRALNSSSAADIEILEMQANVYRYALLLVIHRLKHPLASGDDMARKWSDMILAGIERLLSVASQIPDRHAPPGRESNFDYRLALPFFVAAVEVDDPVERGMVLDKLRTVVSKELYSHVLGMMREAIIFTWDTRDKGSVPYLFDTISKGPALVLL